MRQTPALSLTPLPVHGPTQRPTGEQQQAVDMHSHASRLRW
ncbi:MAG: hypothetical protein U1E98_01495 [Moraxella osloensis]